jgi:predicted RNA binding protein YcfA (HicA-like mRNA interferase family)
MGKCADLLTKARNNPNGLRFNEVRAFAECAGFFFDRQKGSHMIYKRGGYKEHINLQRTKDGKAKPYQVRDVLRHIDALDLGDDFD